MQKIKTLPLQGIESPAVQPVAVAIPTELTFIEIRILTVL
jgi:hypothetical protein